MMFHLMSLHNILVWSGLLSGHLLGNSRIIRIAICSHCIWSICNFRHFPFGFKELNISCTSTTAEYRAKIWYK